MNLERSTEWLQRQGHKIFKTESSYWYDQGPKVFQAFPYHGIISLSPDELQSIFQQTRAIALRYSTPVDSHQGKLSYHVIYEQDTYDLSALPKKARHDITHGLNHAAFEPIPMTRLAKEGWNLRHDTLVRQGRENAETKEFWQCLCLSADGLPEFEAWGALHEDSLVAAIFAFTYEDTVSIIYQQSSTAHLKFGINNALTYVFTQAMLLRPGIKRIFYGLHSLDAPSSVDEFKFRMGYVAKPVRQRVVFNPIAAPLFNKFTYAGLKTARFILPGNPTFAKAEGMLRFYLQGKRPLAEQDWPEVLMEQKDAILAQSARA
jgi:hypothetical protein